MDLVVLCTETGNASLAATIFEHLLRPKDATPPAYIFKTLLPFVDTLRARFAERDLSAKFTLPPFKNFVLEVVTKIIAEYESTLASMRPSTTQAYGYTSGSGVITTTKGSTARTIFTLLLNNIDTAPQLIDQFFDRLLQPKDPAEGNYFSWRVMSFQKDVTLELNARGQAQKLKETPFNNFLLKICLRSVEPFQSSLAAMRPLGTQSYTAITTTKGSSLWNNFTLILNTVEASPALFQTLFQRVLKPSSPEPNYFTTGIAVFQQDVRAEMAARGQKAKLAELPFDSFFRDVYSKAVDSFQPSLASLRAPDTR